MIYLWVGFGSVTALLMLYSIGKMLPKLYQFAAETVLPHPPKLIWPVAAGVGAIVDAQFANRTAQRLADEDGLPVWLIPFLRLRIRLFGQMGLRRYLKTFGNRFPS